MEEENSWIFDSLICFLNGPIWQVPLQSFIEEKSLIFEPNIDENPEYKNIFDEFKNLVDFMLGNLMDDMGITSDQFEKACNTASYYPLNFDHNLFEQIWAANDYEMFKRMMKQKNVELQLQALELIEQKYGITPQSFIPKKEEEALINVEKGNIDFEEDIMKEVAEKFSKVDLSPRADVQYILEEKKNLEKTLKEESELSEKSLSQATLEKPAKMKEQTPASVPTSPNSPEKASNSNISSAELKKRQEYLRAQRDKLVALKKEVRKKHLDTDTKEGIRPKSAKAAKAVLSGEKSSPDNTTSPQLQLRKALAERLRAEVVTKKT